MSNQLEDIPKLKSKLQRFEKEQAEVSGKLSGINSQLKEIGISSDENLEDWIEANKKELEKMKEKSEKLIEDVQSLLEQYEDEEDEDE